MTSGVNGTITLYSNKVIGQFTVVGNGLPYFYHEALDGYIITSAVCRSNVHMYCTGISQGAGDGNVFTLFTTETLGTGINYEFTIVQEKE